MIAVSREEMQRRLDAATQWYRDEQVRLEAMAKELLRQADVAHWHARECEVSANRFSLEGSR